MKHLLPLIFFCCLLSACTEKRPPRQTVFPNQPRTKDNPPTALIKIEIDSAFPDTMAYLPYYFVNLTGDSIGYGDAYTVERFEDGGWRRIPLPQGHAFLLVGRFLAPHDTVHSHILNHFRTPGLYRVKKEIANYYYSAEFRLIKTIK